MSTSKSETTEGNKLREVPRNAHQRTATFVLGTESNFVQKGEYQYVMIQATNTKGLSESSETQMQIIRKRYQ